MSYIGPYPLPIKGGGTNQTTNPSFFAYASANLAGVTGDGTNYTVLFDSTSFDTTSSYNTGTGIYTAPVTGKYLFFTNITAYPFSNPAQTGSVLSFNVSTGAQYYIGYCNPYAMANATQLVYSGSSIISLTAAQTVKVVYGVSSGAAGSITLAGAAIGSFALTTFGGYLLV